MKDPRGHRPLTRGREVYTPVAAPPPVSGRGRYGARPTAATERQLQEEKKEIPDSGGCVHASESMVSDTDHTLLH